jgi:hypothetical protein
VHATTAATTEAPTPVEDTAAPAAFEALEPSALPSEPQRRPEERHQFINVLPLAVAASGAIDQLEASRQREQADVACVLAVPSPGPGITV